MIDIKTDAGIAVLTLTHGKANALDIEFCEALTARFQELRKSDAKAVVLTGQGKIFSAGVDLMRLSEGGADYVRKFLPALHKLYDAVFYHPKPVVAAINGHAIAGGCVLACCADRRIMARDERPHRRDRIAGGRAVSGARLRDRALRGAAALSAGVHAERRDLRDRRGACNAAGSMKSSSPGDLMEDAIAVAQTLAALVAAGLRADQDANPPGR